MSKLEKIQKYVAKGKESRLLKLTHDKDQEVRMAAIAGLGQVGKDDGFNALITMMTDPSPEIRAASARALGVMKNEHAKAHLAYRLEHETDERVIGAIKETIAALREV